MRSISKIQPWLLAFLGGLGLALLQSCGTTEPQKINRDFSIPLTGENGYIYGRVGHYHKFGSKFKISFTNKTDHAPAHLPLDIYSSDPDTADFFIELPPGEYVLNQVVPKAGASIDIPSLKKKEHREFFVETGKITYVGSWIFAGDSLHVVDEKEAQDGYMRINFRNVLTTGALSTLP